MMKHYTNPIYVPKGAAREYSPLALNLYLSCGHGCKYCYAPRVTHKKDADFHVREAEPRKGIIEALEKQLTKLDNAGTQITEQVLLSFIGDPYGPTTDEGKTTSKALEILCRYDVPTAILTKDPEMCLLDLDIIRNFKNIMIGTTLVFADQECKNWEPNAPMTTDRMEILSIFKERGIKTFVSMEPVIYIEDSIRILRALVQQGTGDIIKLGKLNGQLENQYPVDWTKYLKTALEILRPSGRAIYVKNDLAATVTGIEYLEYERDADHHCVQGDA